MRYVKFDHNEPAAAAGGLPRPPAVLVVEDDHDVRMMVADGLGQAGYTVATAEDGPSALAMMSDSRPDLVLLDVSMPGMSGLEVCRKIRFGSDTRRVPVLLLTGCDDGTSVAEGVAAGADSYVVKPVGIKQLLWEIGDLLSRTSRRDL
jgi:DNA-binding response OmpR family regulator